jgi:pimeloyl-ACP methyl ester carboxylesterase
MTERYVGLSCGRVRVREAGDGPTIVLVHGALVNGHLWDDVVPLLADRNRVVVPDLPLGCHAEPIAPEAPLGLPGLASIVDELLAALDLDNVTLVGNDTGGGVCQVVVTRHPSRIGAVVLTSCDAFENCPPRFFKFLVWGSHLPGFVWQVAQSMRWPWLARLPLAFGRLTRRGLDRGRLDAFFAPTRASAGVRRDARRMLLSLDPADTQRAAHDLPTVTIPVLIAWSADDRIFPPDHGERLAALLPNATSRPISDSLAFSPIDQPDALAARIRTFVDDHTRRT